MCVVGCGCGWGGVGGGGAPWGYPPAGTLNTPLRPPRRHTGIVRFVQTDAVRAQLDAGSVVLLSNLGYSASGEVLNCDTYTVATRAAVDLDADKLIVLTVPESMPGHLELPLWLALSDAERLLRDAAAADGVEALLEDDLQRHAPGSVGEGCARGSGWRQGLPQGESRAAGRGWEPGGGGRGAAGGAGRAHGFPC